MTETIESAVFVLNVIWPGIIIVLGGFLARAIYGFGYKEGYKAGFYGGIEKAGEIIEEIQQVEKDDINELSGYAFYHGRHK